MHRYTYIYTYIYIGRNINIYILVCNTMFQTVYIYIATTILYKLLKYVYIHIFNYIYMYIYICRLNTHRMYIYIYICIRHPAAVELGTLRSNSDIAVPPPVKESGRRNFQNLHLRETDVLLPQRPGRLHQDQRGPAGRGRGRSSFFCDARRSCFRTVKKTSMSRCIDRRWHGTARIQLRQ